MSLREAAQIAAMAADMTETGSDADASTTVTRQAILSFGAALREHLTALETALAELLAATHTEVPLIDQPAPTVAPENEKPDVAPPPGFTPQ